MTGIGWSRHLEGLPASVPTPRLHTVRYAGVLASPSPLRGSRSALSFWLVSRRSRRLLQNPQRTCRTARAYRPWAELLERTFGFEVLTCPCCSGRMKLLALVTVPKSIADGTRAKAACRARLCRSGRTRPRRRSGDRARPRVSTRHFAASLRVLEVPRRVGTRRSRGHSHHVGRDLGR